MKKEAGAPQSSVDQKIDVRSEKKRPDLQERVRAMNAKRAAEYQSMLEKNRAEFQPENDNDRKPSPQEIILQQEAKRRRRIEMLTEMASVDDELEMQKGLDSQSEAYIASQLQTVGKSQEDLSALEAKHANMQKSFFKRTFGRLFGGEKKLNASIEKTRSTYAEQRGMLEGAQNEYFRSKTGTVELSKRAEALHAEADQLDKEIAQFVSFKEKSPEKIQRTPEEAAREQLFTGMSAEDIQEQQAALRSERTVLEASAKAFDKSIEQLRSELQVSEQPIAAIQNKVNQFGEFLKSLNAEHEQATQRLGQAEARQKELSASFWSRLVNKQEILTLAERIKEEKVILQGLDHHFLETQQQAAALHSSPEVQISQQKYAELMSQMNKLTQKQELTRKRLLENQLQSTEAELAMKRVQYERPAPAAKVESVEQPSNRPYDLVERLKRQRAQKNKSSDASVDQRMAA